MLGIQRQHGTAAHCRGALTRTPQRLERSLFLQASRRLLLPRLDAKRRTTVASGTMESAIANRCASYLLFLYYGGERWIVTRGKNWRGFVLSQKWRSDSDGGL
jgi:hypothetical protein